MFSNLLQQIALEHDREVANLQAEIDRLTRGQLRVDADELVIQRKVPEELGISVAEVIPVLPLTELEEQVAQESVPILRQCRDAPWKRPSRSSKEVSRSDSPEPRPSSLPLKNSSSKDRIIAGPISGLEDQRDLNKSDIYMDRKDLNQKDLDQNVTPSQNQKDLEQNGRSSSNQIVLHRSSSKISTNLSSSCDTTSTFGQRSTVSISERNPLERWQVLIQSIDLEGNPVRLNPKYLDLLDQEGLNDDDFIGKTSSRRSLMDAIHATVSHIHTLKTSRSGGVRPSTNSRNSRNSRQSVRSSFTAGSRPSVMSMDDQMSLEPSVRSQMLKDTRRCRPEQFVLHPNSRLRLCWDILGLVLLVHDLILIPLQVFDVGTKGLGDAYEKVMKNIDYYSIFFWTLDVLVSFMTGYYTREGFVEIRHSRIGIHYFGTWFPLDISIVTVDWASLALNLDNTVGYLRIGKTTARFMRILRLLRFMKMSATLSMLINRIQSEYWLTLVGVCRLLVGIIVINHYIACGWYAMSQIDVEKTWSNKFLQEDEEMFYAYATALHWSLTQFTPASMEVHPTNEFERMYAIVVIIGAMVTFSSFVSSITGAMTYLRQLNARQSEQDAAIRKYFSQNKISQKLASQVWHFRRRNKMGAKKIIKESDLPALKYLPERLRERLRMEVYTPILQNHPLLNKYSDLCPQALLEICNQAVSERQLIPGEPLKELKEKVKFMFFVCDGEIDYLPDGDWKKSDAYQAKEARVSWVESLRTNSLRGPNARRRLFSSTDCPPKDPCGTFGFQVKPGEWACEIALWANRAKTAGPFVADDRTGCELALLHAEEFQKIVGQHPKGFPLMAHYSENFVKRFNSAHQSSCTGNVLFNDVDEVQNIVRMSIRKVSERKQIFSPLAPLKKVGRLQKMGSKTLNQLLHMRPRSPISPTRSKDTLQTKETRDLGECEFERSDSPEVASPRSK